jgi:hypothetical protein
MVMRNGTLLACMLCLASTAQADTLYKYRDKDGKVVYADRRIAPGPAQKEIHAPRDTPGELWTRWAQREIAAYDQAERIDFFRRQRALASADARLLATERAYGLQHLRRAGSAVPLPGERVGNAGGGSRLREEYFARQAIEERRLLEAQRNYLDAIEYRRLLR